MDSLIGKMVGRWLVKERFRDGKKYSYKYLCECQCERKTRKVLDKNRLVHNKVSDCGCVRVENRLKESLSRIGEKHNSLTITELVVEEITENSSIHKYKTICDCGKESETLHQYYEIKKGRVKTCGKCILRIPKVKKQREYKIRENIFIEHEDYIEGIDDKGKSFIFDKDDFDRVKSLGRYLSVRNTGYVFICDKKNGDWQLHRFIMGIGRFDEEAQIIADHINGIKTDNRKSNLRVCHKSKNAMNARTYKNNTSGHKGVTWMARLSKWQAEIYCNKKAIYLGVFDKFEDAVKVRKEAEIKYFGVYSRDYCDLAEESSDDV